MRPAHEIVPDAEEREKRIWFLHGIFGAGRNWGTVARRLVERRPDWGAVLVDLRLHGGSRPADPPHTIDACVRDLEELGADRGRPTSVLGHSFGGKVALAYLGRGDPSLRQVWVVDSTPSARPPGGSAVEMLEAVRALPGEFGDREEAFAALRERGFSTPVARWMTTNLERAGDSFTWRFDVDGVESLLDDFFATDLWRIVERPPPSTSIRFLKATRSDVLPEEECARLNRIGERGRPVRVERIEGGHWLNADAPDGVVDALTRGLT